VELTTEEKQRRTVRMLTEYLHQMPILPKVMAVFSELEPGEKGFTEKVEFMVRLDPSLLVRLLYLSSHTSQLAESQPLTVEGIFAKVGAKALQENLFSISTVPVFIPKSFAEKELWFHSLQVAMTAKALASRIPNWGISPDEAYVCGLIHEIGRFIMLATSQKQFNEIATAGWKTGTELVQSEHSICGFDHQTLGWMAARSWNFPERLANVIRFHHGNWNFQSKVADERTVHLIHLVRVADSISFLMVHRPEFLAAHPKLRAEQIVKHNFFPPEGFPLGAKEIVEFVDQLQEASLKLVRKIISLKGDFALDKDAA
jgi:putative nucleotidyltransferase with HDIG domain